MDGTVLLYVALYVACAFGRSSWTAEATRRRSAPWRCPSGVGDVVQYRGATLRRGGDGDDSSAVDNPVAGLWSLNTALPCS